MTRLRPPVRSSRPATGRCAPTSRGGFTLLELMLVLGVLAVLVALSYPFISRSYERHYFDAAVNDVRNRLANSRVYAVDHGVMYQFRYERQGRRYLVIPYEVDLDVDASTDISGRYPSIVGQLPEGMQFEEVVREWERDADPNASIPIAEELVAGLPDGKELLSANWSMPILFRTDGEVEGLLEFSIVDEQKRMVGLSVRRLTGAVFVGDVTQQEAP